ncbi:thiol-disulfide oxidoreductase DCC family protein [Roseicitreum antarcticum]|uniref:Predicted thiol-disulfide oxidoreductase YuxK, DCC family n=1 Tax=Roseicitreum antarcticum TaxID=564137 RepID=A0A1H3BUJ8_9RHOB|nr:DUF393 domain-containing protein [Roseicitreum antarcticum]SDX45451.1 Predicted thiol-disulfide oxidoreductase YuxK, DCC family [Roseicitreum antarcticum]
MVEKASSPPAKTELSVLYNAACPVCAREIDHYARHADRHALPIRFDGLQTADPAAYGVSADTAARRLHVLHDGRVLSGVPAFVALWRAMPGYRWLARIVDLPGLRQLSAAVYDHALAPLLYRLHLRRSRKRD